MVEFCIKNTALLRSGVWRKWPNIQEMKRKCNFRYSRLEKPNNMQTQHHT
ncbi:hypothetical protein HMPREF9065_02097 [Aggregatibacter sp. oral taxon 458 str. W10330]|nr:hypothetical protein HMPREF9065_02097 [Aggregatibacter sp. oral taxon 458 str. W10330]